MAQTQTVKLVNGVDVPALKESLDAIREDPSLAKFQLRAQNQWENGSHNHTQINEYLAGGIERRRRDSFHLDSDEPRELQGDDTAPNPVEWLLHALAGCVTTTMVYHAASRGIEIECIESQLEGDIDIQGFTGLSEQTPKGYQAIRVNFKVRSDAPAETLVDLAKFSPVYNSLKGSVPIEITVEKV